MVRQRCRTEVGTDIDGDARVPRHLQAEKEKSDEVRSCVRISLAGKMSSGAV